jgi:hypothetical protein
MKRLIVFLCFMGLGQICLGASNTTPTASWEDKNISIASPIDVDGWVTGVTFATSAHSSPYSPVTISTATTGPISSTIYMRNYNGVMVRAKYARATTLTTDPIIAVWGYRSGGWSVLKSSASARTFTLADSATTDVDDGVTYKFTDPTPPLDTQGAYKVVVTVITKGVESASGPITLEITRY